MLARSAGSLLAGLACPARRPSPPLSSAYRMTPAGQLVGAHLNRMFDAIPYALGLVIPLFT
ncbi:MAG: hypothetical protein ACJ72W_27040, partial [Actinoallomurus sp.]